MHRMNKLKIRIKGTIITSKKGLKLVTGNKAVLHVYRKAPERSQTLHLFYFIQVHTSRRRDCGHICFLFLIDNIEYTIESHGKQMGFSNSRHEQNFFITYWFRGHFVLTFQGECTSLIKVQSKILVFQYESDYRHTPWTRCRWRTWGQLIRADGVRGSTLVLPNFTEFGRRVRRNKLRPGKPKTDG